jgi:LytS/YehU family sensor histidine kinase
MFNLKKHLFAGTFYFTCCAAVLFSLPIFRETIFSRATLIGLLITGIIFGAAVRAEYINARSKENLNINNQINELKHKALSSMMNPHFIFNSLNTVQYLINIDRKREANDYISLMAKLIRMNLETASQSFIRLDEEINRLELYLEIEKLRFSEKFNYEISVEKDITPCTIMIPNMIIQPFVENSICHGIVPSGRVGFLKLSFNFENITVNESAAKFFAIRITDNGIGFTEAQKCRKDGHISKGIQIIQERLVLLSKERNLPEPIIEDLNIKEKDARGTEVLLSIPPELYKIIN